MTEHRHEHVKEHVGHARAQLADAKRGRHATSEHFDKAHARLSAAADALDAAVAKGATDDEFGALRHELEVARCILGNIAD